MVQSWPWGSRIRVKKTLLGSGRKGKVMRLRALDSGSQLYFDAPNDLQGCPMTYGPNLAVELQGCPMASGPKLAVKFGVPKLAKNSAFFQECFEVLTFFCNLTKQRNIFSGTIIKFSTMEPNNMTICYWIFLETSSQMIMLRVMPNFLLFRDMLRKMKNFYVDLIT